MYLVNLIMKEIENIYKKNTQSKIGNKILPNEMLQDKYRDNPPTLLRAPQMR